MNPQQSLLRYCTFSSQIALPYRYKSAIKSASQSRSFSSFHKLRRNFVVSFHIQSPIGIDQYHINLNRSYSSTQSSTLSKIRNIGIIAHVDAGKTTTAECILYYAGKSRRIGEVDRGDTMLDYLKMERERGITIQSAAITLAWKDHTLNLIDTPGHVDFTVEVERSVRVLDGAIAVFDAKHGVQAQSETVWRQADRYGVPRIAFLNKMDRDGANIDKTTKMLRDKLHSNPIVIQVPIGEAAMFLGVIDLIHMKAIEFDGEHGELMDIRDLNDEELKRAEGPRQRLIEQISDLDDSVMERYLEGKPIDADILRRALRKITIDQKGVPVLCGSSLQRLGVQPILDAVVDYLPSPIEKPPIEAKSEKGDIIITTQDKGPLVALAFKVIHDFHRGLLVYFRVYSGSVKVGDHFFNSNQKTRERVMKLCRVEANDLIDVPSISAGDIGAAIGLKQTRTGDTLLAFNAKPMTLPGILTPPPVFFCSIEPIKSSDEKTLIESLRILQMEDPSFQVHTDADSGQLLISGMGELHLEIIKDRIINHYKVPARTSKALISYRGTLKFDHYDSLTIQFEMGGRKQSASMKISMAPAERGSGNKLKFSVPDEMIQSHIAVDELKQAILEGVELAWIRGVYGYPMMDVEANVEEISIEADSSLVSFRRCATQLANKIIGTSQPKLLEPIMKVEISLEDQYIGTVLSDLSNVRRGKIKSMDEESESQESQRNGSFGGKIVHADVPLKELIGYSTSLRSMTKGNASFTMEFKEYGDMSHLSQELVLKEVRGF